MKFEDLKTGDLFTVKHSTTVSKAVFMKSNDLGGFNEVGICVSPSAGWNVGEYSDRSRAEVEIYRGEVTVTEKPLTFKDVEVGQKFTYCSFDYMKITGGDTKKTGATINAVNLMTFVPASISKSAKVKIID